METQSGLGREKIWVVRSAGRVLGPYSLEELIHQLKEKNISVIDEVRTPESRWGFIRDHKQLSEVVEFLRDQSSLSREQTELMSTRSMTGSRYSDDLTPTPELNFRPKGNEEKTEVRPFQNPSGLPSLPAHKRPEGSPIDVQYHDVKTEITPPPLPLVQTDASEGTPIIERMVWSIAFLAVLGMIVLVLHKQGKFLFGKGEAAAVYSEQDFNLGKYNRCLEGLSATPTLDSDKLIKLALLQVQIGKQPVEGRRTLERLGKEIPNSVKLDANVIYGLSYMREQNWDSAQKYFKKSESSNHAIQVLQNMATIELMKGSYDSAYLAAQRLIDDGHDDPMNYLLKAASVFRIENKSRDKEKVKKALDELVQFSEKAKNYKIELLLYRAAIQLKWNDRAAGDDSIDALLKTDPLLTSNHVQNLWVDRQVAGWDSLSGVCDFVAGGEATARTQALKALCLFENGETGKALRLVESGKQQFAADHLFIPLQSFLLKQSGQAEQAQSLAKLMAHSAPILLQVVAGDICIEKQDLDCAENSFRKALILNPNELAAIAGMAKVNFAMGKVSAAEELVKKGLAISPSYQPLVVLKLSKNDK